MNIECKIFNVKCRSIEIKVLYLYLPFTFCIGTPKRFDFFILHLEPINPALWGWGLFNMNTLTFILLQTETLSKGVINSLVYAIIGILVSILSFKIVDFIIPGKLSHQIAEDRNVAVAIVAASLILGICIIIAAAIHG
jgi:putative membrane protein